MVTKPSWAWTVSPWNTLHRDAAQRSAKPTRYGFEYRHREYSRCNAAASILMWTITTICFVFEQRISKCCLSLFMHLVCARERKIKCLNYVMLCAHTNFLCVWGGGDTCIPSGLPPTSSRGPAGGTRAFLGWVRSARTRFGVKVKFWV
jgi:hypothetical protein